MISAQSKLRPLTKTHGGKAYPSTADHRPDASAPHVRRRAFSSTCPSDRCQTTIVEGRRLTPRQAPARQQVERTTPRQCPWRAPGRAAGSLPGAAEATPGRRQSDLFHPTGDYRIATGFLPDKPQRAEITDYSSH